MRWCLSSPSLPLASSSFPNLTRYAALPRVCATADPKDELSLDTKPSEPPLPSSSSPSLLGKDLKKVVNKTAATFAPRASTASKNPALPGTTLYKVFEVQGYASMLLGGVLSFNLLFPSNQPDLWRLMGMWSIWMFSKSPSSLLLSRTTSPLPLILLPLLPAIPSLRARDCPTKEKEALNYLFLLIPLLNVAIPFFWKSFPLVWSADTLAFFAMYAWKVYLRPSLFLILPCFFFTFFLFLLQLGWLERTET